MLIPGQTTNSIGVTSHSTKSSLLRNIPDLDKVGFQTKCFHPARIVQMKYNYLRRRTLLVLDCRLQDLMNSKGRLACPMHNRQNVSETSPSKRLRPDVCKYCESEFVIQ